MTARVRGRDHLVGLLLAAGYVVLLLVTSTDLAMSRDESFYVIAAERYGGWIEQLVEHPSAALEQRAIDRAWRYNHEHPALMKTAFALSQLADDRWELFTRDSMAYRFPGMLTGGLLLWLVYIFGARLHSRMAGAFAAGALALMPRFFYHAHLDAFDVPIALMITLVTYCYWRSLTRPGWAAWTGVAFGLALATKHNSWIVPGVLAIHWGWVVIGERAARRRGEPRRVSFVPWWLLGMVVLGPPLFVGSWPWLWHDTLARIGGYAQFHLQHVAYDMEYFGTNYFEAPFPVSFPFVMTAMTVSLTTLALAGVGLATRGRALLPSPLARRVWPGGSMQPDRTWTDVLLIGSLLAPMVAIAWPTTPIFGGTKHWLGAYPFLALYAGLGFAYLVRVVRAQLPAWMRARSYLIPSVAVTVLLAPAAVDTVHSHPFGLSHYGFLAGGVPGAADKGMNRQFWGFTTGSLAKWLRTHLPEGGRVWTCDTTRGAWRMMQRDGMLPNNIRATRNMAAADYALVHHELHFAEVDYQAWVAYGTVQPAHVLTYDGVPIISVYENVN